MHVKMGLQKRPVTSPKRGFLGFLCITRAMGFKNDLELISLVQMMNTMIIRKNKNIMCEQNDVLDIGEVFISWYRINILFCNKLKC